MSFGIKNHAIAFHWRFMMKRIGYGFLAILIMISLTSCQTIRQLQGKPDKTTNTSTPPAEVLTPNISPPEENITQTTAPAPASTPEPTSNVIPVGKPVAPVTPSPEQAKQPLAPPVIKMKSEGSSSDGMSDKPNTE
jgi:hypothetical protein